MHRHEVAGDPGYGADEPIMDLNRLKPILKSLFAVLELVVPAYAFTRFSVLSLYLRVFTGKKTRLASYVLIVTICCQWVAFEFATLFQCTPVKFYGEFE